MQTLISPNTANSIESNGLFVSDDKFFDKYNNELSIEWVSYLYWTNQNRSFGSNVAGLKLACLSYRHGFNSHPEYQKFIN